VGRIVDEVRHHLEDRSRDIWAGHAGSGKLKIML
jgi:hypothetical protein